ncbi:hypothetical protein QQX98_004949 [Neonectria punicea]|uniref:Ornithine aminotransferase n=1 Tax=Neonectria punicea TaxID=979145 RepID=A0ABR1H767_9HYPO
MCKAHDILFIADEIRMGCGKTGRFLSCEHLGPTRQPDLITLGKSITGGLYPASYILGRAQCMDLVESKEILSTYSFSPVAVAATTASLQVIDEERLVQRASEIETLFLSVAREWRYSIIHYVTARGGDLGVWLQGVEQSTCRRICEDCMRNGLLVFPSLLRVRMSIPLVISNAEFVNGLTILGAVLAQVSAETASDIGQGSTR